MALHDMAYNIDTCIPVQALNCLRESVIKLSPLLFRGKRETGTMPNVRYEDMDKWIDELWFSTPDRDC